ncbi:hypothetical protein [Nitratiruptor tergarcus]|uniref:Translation initiation factor eIF-2B subunit delta n=1 Tax=Nitratiruptor tergarcus DSM 16512 TaxID=1069081 RepID=A0A1W1WSF3_9BACT|nr:hypothetical protein [Nitratiruptor tergarcus]SMC09248.1 translation initiation factor eIF-2B subunit delta [Nitratiruptor tergarcus DSM 16512]
MKWWEKEIDEIANDSFHGATYLTKKSIELVKKASFNELPLILPKLKNAQPFMASIYNFASFIENNLQNFSPTLCDKWWIEFEKANELIVQKAAPILRGKKILTHSFSSLVYKALLEAKDVQVLCTESRPKNEGRVLAQQLLQDGIDATLIIDAAAATLIKEVDVVVFGADGIGSFGLVHKVGSFPIALAAYEMQVPLMSLCPKQKIWPSDYALPKEERNPQELHFPNAINIYFDITPSKYITKIIN